MSEHRYPLSTLLGDYARAGLGFALTGAPILFLSLNVYVVAVLAALAAVFALFGGLTLLRHLRRIDLGEDGISASGWRPVRLDWNALDAVNLRYFTTRRDGARGWMELKLSAAGRRLLLDSRIAGFHEIAASVARAVRRRHLAISQSTASNFSALGIEIAHGIRE